MEDSFFKFGKATFGSQKTDGDLLTADVEEDVYDALNNETFGDAVFDGDWEGDHEKLAELISPVKELGLLSYDDDFDGADGSKEVIEQSISQLGLEDDLDDEAQIKSYVKSSQTRPFPCFRSSPPPPAIIDTEECGSPKTRTIWSTDTSNLSTPPQNNSRLDLLLKSLQSPRNAAGPQTLQQQSSQANILPFILPHQETVPSSSPGPLMNARRLEDVERDLLQSDKQKNTSWNTSSPSSSLNSKVIQAEKLEEEMMMMMGSNNNSSWEEEEGRKAWYRSTAPPMPIPGRVQTLHEVEKGLLQLNTTPNRSQMADDLEKFLQGMPGGGELQQRTNNDHHQRPPPGFPKAMHYNPGMGSVRNVQPPIGTPPQSSGLFSHLTGSPVCSTSPVPIGRMSPMVVGNMFRPPPNMSGSVLPQHPLLNPQRMGAPFTHPNGLPVNRGVMHPIRPLDPNIIAQADLRRLLYPRQINHPFLNKQWIPQGGQAPNLGMLMKQNMMNNNNQMRQNNDDYSGLMSQREKDWLIKIQMLQLHTDNPYVDDYYHTTYIMRKMMREKRKADGKDVKLVLPEMGRPENKAYVPIQFENSLGKLQAISVNFPRRVLEMDVQLPWAEEDNRLPANKELHRQRRLLLEIEKLYSLLLEIDDEEKRMLALPEEARVPHQQKREKLIGSLFESLGCINGNSTRMVGQEDKVGQMACIRKGRHLVFRSIILFSHAEQVLLLSCILRNLGSIVRRDVNERILVHYLPETDEVICKSSFEQLVTLGQALKSGMPPELNNGGVAPLATRDRGNYVAALHSQFGVAILGSFSSRAEQIYSDSNNLNNQLQFEWKQIIEHVVNAICSLPVIGFHNSMTSDLLTHLQRFSIEEDKKEILRVKMDGGNQQDIKTS